MYNGTIDNNSISKEDVTLLEKYLSALSAINNGLKEFVSLKKSVEEVQKTLKGLGEFFSAVSQKTKDSAAASTEDAVAKQAEAVAVAEDAAATQAENAVKTVNATITEKEADASSKNALATQGELIATGENVVATEVDNVVTASNTAITEKGTLATIAHTVAKKALAIASVLATGAIQVLNAVMSSSIGIIGVVIAVAAGLIAIFSKEKTQTEEVSKAYKAQVAEVDELIAAQEKLAQATQESADSFDGNISQMDVNRSVAKRLMAEVTVMSNGLKKLRDNAEDTTKKEQDMAIACAKLNAAVDGLNIAYDAETGAIRNLNTGEEVELSTLKELVDAKSDLAESEVWTERYNELLAEQVQIQEALLQVRQEQQDVENNAGLTESEKLEALNRLKEAEFDYTNQMVENAGQQAEANRMLSELSAESANQTIENFDRVTTVLNSSGETIEDVSARCGVAAEIISAAMEAQGITLDEWEAAWNEHEEQVQERIDGMVNGFREIPEKFEMTGEEMLENLKTNQARYKEWEDDMETITARLGPAAAEHFRKLGPEAYSAIHDIANTEGMLEQYAVEFDKLTEQAANAGIENLGNPELAAAPVEALNDGSKQISENTALADAMGEQIEGAQTAIKEKESTVVNQVKALLTSINSTLEEMLSSWTSIGSRMMDGMLAGMNAGAGKVYSKADEIGNRVAKTMRYTLQVRSPSRVMRGIFENVMLGITDGMDAMKDKVYATAAGIAEGVSARLTVSPELASVTNAALLSNASRYAAAPSVSGLSDDAGLLRRTLALLDQYLPALANMNVVMDTGATVGRLAPAMDDALGRIARQKERG